MFSRFWSLNGALTHSVPERFPECVTEAIFRQSMIHEISIARYRFVTIAACRERAVYEWASHEDNVCIWKGEFLYGLSGREGSGWRKGIHAPV